MRIQQQSSSNKKWYVLTAVIIGLTIALLVGYFAWYIPSQNNQNLPEPEADVVKNTTDKPTVTEINNQVSSPNDDTRDPSKAPEQYDGQNASGDSSNANCIDANCSNFAIPEEETL